MIGNIVNDGIHKFYYLIKLNTYFAFVCLLGGILFGIGPSYMAILSIHHNNPWDAEHIRFRHAIRDFRQFFFRGNSIVLTFLILMFVLTFSLITTVQMKGLFFLALSLLDMFIVIVLFITAMLSCIISINYQVSFKNCIKLALLLFFKDIKIVGAIGFFLVSIVLVGYNQPTLFILCGLSSSAVFISVVSNRFFSRLI